MSSHRNLLPSLLVSVILAAVAGSTACGPSDAVEATYRVVFELTNAPEDLAALHFEVDYDVGELVGSGAAADCDLLEDDDGETADFDDDDNGTVDVDIDAVDNPIAEDTEIVACNFLSPTQPTANNFTITILDAEDGDGNDVQPGEVDVIVSSTDIATASIGGTEE